MTRHVAATTRRRFLHEASTCAAHVLLMSAAAPLSVGRLWAAPRKRVVFQEPWGRLEEVAEGVWAMVSTPLQDRTTLCNGGIIAGRTGVLVVESFGSEAGAAWMAARARDLTGAWPTHVVLTHYHGDHTGGLGGFSEGPAPEIRATGTTLSLTRAGDERRGVDLASPRGRLLADVVLLPESGPTSIDLGGRTARVAPYDGHTSSDVTVELEDPSVVFCGDLVWNGMFPNYVDATPSRLSRSVSSLIRGRETTYVPGHGSLADGAAMEGYVTLLDSVETAAREALAAGATAEEAGERYRIPSGLGEWTLFNPAYFSRAIGAWLAELSA